jgi:hypothetical protein
MSDAILYWLKRAQAGSMATFQAVVTVLPQAIIKVVLFFWCPCLPEEEKVQVNLETPSCLWVFMISAARIGACSGPVCA